MKMSWLCEIPQFLSSSANTTYLLRSTKWYRHQCTNHYWCDFGCCWKDYPEQSCNHSSKRLSLDYLGRRRLYNKFKKTNSLHFWNQFKILRNKTTELLRKSKQDYYFDKLENILTNVNLNSKQFWKTSKQLLLLGKSSQSIPTLYHNNEYSENELQKANMLNDYLLWSYSWWCQQNIATTYNHFTRPPWNPRNNPWICQRRIWWPWFRQSLWPGSYEYTSS